MTSQVARDEVPMHPRHPVRWYLHFVWFSAVFSAGRAMAGTVLLTTSSHGQGEDGVRLDLDYSHEAPCVLGSPVAVDWDGVLAGSKVEGNSIGIDRNYPCFQSSGFVWASIAADFHAKWCRPRRVRYCIGAARYDVQNGTLEHYAYPGTSTTPYKALPVNPDVLATSPDRIVITEKRYEQAVLQFDEGGTIARRWAPGVRDPSALASLNPASSPAGLDLFLATFAGGTWSADECDRGGKGASGPQKGSLYLFQANWGPLDEYSFADGSKPEGVDVVDRRSGFTASCPQSTSSLDYRSIAYVADYCTSMLYVFAVSVVPWLTRPPAVASLHLVTRISLDTDNSGNSSWFLKSSGRCHPSSVAFHRPTNDVYVLCQQRGTIMRIHAARDQCAPRWSASRSAKDEVKLRYVPGVRYSRCGSGRVGPGIPCDGGCQPHGIAYEPYSMELKDWLFVNLSWRRTAGEEQPDRGRRGSRPPGQVLAVKVGDLEEQYVMYADESGYEPLDLEVVNFPFQVRQP